MTKKVVIKSNFFIEADSIILMCVKIEKGVFISAGSVVNKDIDLFTMVGGCPVKVIKKLII